MKKVTLESYKKDRYYPRVVRAVAALRARNEVVSPVALLVETDLLRAADLESWRFGRIPYLEKVIRCNLAQAGRILRLLRMHAHDLNMQPSQTRYRKWGRGPKAALRFTKSGAPALEEAYSRHFLAPGISSKKGREKPPGLLPSGSDPKVELKDEMLDENDLSGGVRAKYASPFADEES